MKTIYNEGRVVGLSAYELYVRQLLSTDPDAKLLSERQWLASTLGGGSTLVLKIANGTSKGVVDYVLPEGSDLIGCRLLFGTVFDGTVATIDGTPWGKVVTDYGKLVRNDSTSHPTTPGNSSDVPHKTISLSGKVVDLDSRFVAACKEYPKIVQGMFFQPGKWSETPEAAMFGLGADLTPAMKESGFVRLYISDDIKSDVYVAMTGFLHKGAIAGITEFDTPIQTSAPEDGDYLGPESFPWGTRIVFIESNERLAAADSLNAYIRKLPSTGSSTRIAEKPVIDMKATDPKTYYTSNHTSSKVDVSIESKDDVNNNAVIAVYQRSDGSGTHKGTDYPPALYGALIDKTGASSLYPLDTVAPGTIKAFTDSSLASDYPKANPGTFGMEIKSEGTVAIHTPNNTVTSLANASVSTQVSGNKAITTIKAGDNTANVVSLAKADGTTMFDTNGKTASDLSSSDRLTWTNLLDALCNEKYMDLLGKNLRDFRSNLPNVVAPSGNYVKTGTQYVVFNDGKKLWISSSAPTSGMAAGDIGIGW